MSAVDVSWLSTISADTEKEITAHPHTSDVGGELWSWATEGHMLVAVKALSDYPRREFPKIVPGLLTEPAETFPSRATFADLRAWADVSTESPCPECKGTRTVDGVPECKECDGTGEITCVCSACDDEHETDCTRCDGTGKNPDEKAGPQPCPECEDWREPPALGSVEGVVLNRRILDRAIAKLDAEHVGVRVRDKLSPVSFAAEGWRVAIMPRRDGSGKMPALKTERVAQQSSASEDCKK